MLPGRDPPRLRRERLQPPNPRRHGCRSEHRHSPNESASGHSEADMKELRGSTNLFGIAETRKLCMSVMHLWD